MSAFIESWKAVLALPVLALILYAVWRFFRSTWRELDVDAQAHRAAILDAGKTDTRPFIALVLIAVVLTLQEYYGGRIWFDVIGGQWLGHIEERHPGFRYLKYEELWGFAWWAGTRVVGYTFPFVFWKIFFREDSLRDLGLRARGFFGHAWIYGMFLAIVLPAMIVVSHAPDFGAYYPFYKQASRSWFDYLAWEAMYFAQFFALEMFFRGFWLGVLRKSFGSGAIFAMAVPYCMIHFGKPYLEVVGAVVAGIALGSLSMKTKSIYQGFLVHLTVAALMDWLSLRHRHATPLHFWAGDPLKVPSDADEAAREALARTIDRAGIAFFCVVFAVIGWFAWKSWKTYRLQSAAALR